MHFCFVFPSSTFFFSPEKQWRNTFHCWHWFGDQIRHTKSGVTVNWSKWIIKHHTKASLCIVDDHATLASSLLRTQNFGFYILHHHKHHHCHQFFFFSPKQEKVSTKSLNALISLVVQVVMTTSRYLQKNFYSLQIIEENVHHHLMFKSWAFLLLFSSSFLLIYSR